MTSLGLDHVGFLVDDLDATSRTMLTAGFDLTPPVALHDGGGLPTGGVNRTSVLAAGYVELQQLIELGHGHPLERLWPARPCLAVIAWRSTNVRSDRAALLATGRRVSEVEDWSRDTDAGTARVRFCSLVDQAAGPLVILVQHLTPELTIESGYVQRNTVRAVTGCATNGHWLDGLEDTPVGDQPWSVTRVRLEATDPGLAASAARTAGWSVRAGARGRQVVDATGDLGATLEIQQWA